MSDYAEDVYSAFARRAVQKPEGTAVVFDGETLSFAGLMALIERCCRHLSGLGIRRGDRFAVMSQSRPEGLMLYFAAARMGAVICVFGTDLGSDEVEAAFCQSRAKALFCDPAAAALARGVVPGPALHLMGSLRGRTESPPVPVEHIGGPQAFIVSYPSKALVEAVQPHAEHVKALDDAARRWGLTDRDTSLVALPMLGFGDPCPAVAGVLAGGRVILMPYPDPGRVMDFIFANKVSVLHGNGDLIADLLGRCAASDPRMDQSPLRLIIRDGLPFEPEIGLRLPA